MRKEVLKDIRISLYKGYEKDEKVYEILEKNEFKKQNFLDLILEKYDENNSSFDTNNLEKNIKDTIKNELNIVLKDMEKKHKEIENYGAFNKYYLEQLVKHFKLDN